jgi:hypothetical protein
MKALGAGNFKYDWFATQAVCLALGTNRGEADIAV